MAQQISVLGIDIAKLVLHVVGMDESGHVVLRKRLARRELPTFIATLPPVGPENPSQPSTGRLAHVLSRHSPLIVMMQPTHVWHFPDQSNLRPLDLPRHWTIHG